MQVHVICQKAGAAQGSLYDLLTLQGEEAPLSGEAQQNKAGQDRTEFANVHCTFSGMFLERLPGSPVRQSTASLPHPRSSGETQSETTAPAEHETAVECRVVLHTRQATSSEWLALCGRNFQGNPSPMPRHLFVGSGRRGQLLCALDRMMALLFKGKVFFDEMGSFRRG